MIRSALIGVALTVCVACSSAPAAAPPGGVVVKFGKRSLAAEVAATRDTRQQGLMNRRHLGGDAGMLFLFPQDQVSGGFWMRNTLIPLSIAFMRRNGNGSWRVLAVVDMQPCRALPCPIYGVSASYDATLETNLGWFAGAGLGPGSVAKVVGTVPAPS
jgi:uncharacterized membrane protein (UPF0127 family)